ncbi:MAG: family 16 glycosylhydrolase [Bacteroidales bacterium]|jgi:beta-glucanase (GH16 family)|nr:family 16 glycosylhydrolase [Bacteroidales bacterium]
MKRISCLLALLLLFANMGCSGSNGNTPPGEDTKITASPESLTFTYEQSEKTINVISNCEWSITSNSDWCKVSPTGGLTGTSTIKVTVSENPSKEKRTATLTIRHLEYKQEIPVTQDFLTEYVNFTDDAFKAACLSLFDKDGDGKISENEAMNATSMDVSGKGIKSMEGLKYFYNLTSLICRNNSITDLDISALKNLVSLDCSSNKLTGLDISINYKLTSLDCTNNTGLSVIKVWSDFMPNDNFKKPDGASYQQPEIHTPQGYKLVWQDEFNESSENGGSVLPDKSEWWYETGNSGWGNNELENYIPAVSGTDTCAFVSDGSLKIVARKSGSQVLSVRMNTSKSWQYGYFEARLSLPGGKGTWPAFWMMPKNFTKWPDDGEIDIMEEVGYNPDYVSSTIHCAAYNASKGTQKTAQRYISGAEGNFHIYAIEWTSDHIYSYVDGVKLLSYENDGNNNKSTWPFNAPFYLKLNLAWGGNWGGAQGVDESALPCTYKIDYVRVFQKE